MPKNKFLDFNESYSTVVSVNKLHITPKDWEWISAAHPHAYETWKKVPKEDHQYLEQLVRDGCSFAYASLLQVCARNNIKWIHFSDEHALINRLAVFEKEWHLYSPVTQA